MDKKRVYEVSHGITKSKLRKDKRFQHLMQNVSQITTKELYEKVTMLCLEYEIKADYLIENGGLLEKDLRNLVMACMMRYNDFDSEDDEYEYECYEG